MESQDIDLEEAVGSYLNCLSQGCAAGSTLYKCIGKIIDKKFNEIFHAASENEDSFVQSCYQTLQMQNAFEDYQKALLVCKEKLLEILMDSHTKKQSSNKSKRKTSTSEQSYLEIALQVAKELHCYHHTVAQVLKPIFISDFPEDFENATLKNINGQDEIVASWISIVEANRQLRDGYGLNNQELAYILSWQHGEDVSEVHRKKINQRINTIVQQYVDQVCLYGVCEFDIPIAFDLYPDDLPKILQNCCSPTEAFAATAIHIPKLKEEIDVILNRELSRVCLCFNGQYFEKASAGKAFENTTVKLRALRDSISSLVDTKKITASKEQIDLFCLRMLSTCSLSVSGASSRMAVTMAFGKYNLVEVKPYNPDSEKIMYVNVDKDFVEIIVPSKWSITEDGTLFSSLCRENATVPLAVVNVSYHAVVNVEEYFKKRIDPIPVAHITKCVLKKSPSIDVKKEHERSKSIKKKLILKASTKLFTKKTTKELGEPDIITNENVYENINDVAKEFKKEEQPVPPPRVKKKAKKNKIAKESTKEDNVSKESKKEDLSWFSSTSKFSLPPVPTIAGSKDQSPSIASFEELQGVIDFLSGSSSSSLALNDKNEKLRHPFKTHKRNNSTTSLQSNNKEKEKSIVEGKKKLCHRRSASFSGNSAKDEKSTDETSEDEKTKNIEQLKRMSAELDKNIESDKPNSDDTIQTSSNDEDHSASEMPFVERTPGDGMDNRQAKTTFASAINITNKASSVLDDSNTKIKNEQSKKQTVNDKVTPLNISKQSDIEKVKTQPFDMNDFPSNIFKPHKKLCETKSIAISSIVLSSIDKPAEKETAKSEPDNIHLTGIVKDEVFIQENNNIVPPTHPTVNQIKAPYTEKVFVKDSKPPELFENISKPLFIQQPLTKDTSTGTNKSEGQFYEPFNTKLSWPVGIGNKLTSWSDASMDEEKLVQHPLATSERCSMKGQQEQKAPEFTLDKQQDLQKLLEGSKYLLTNQNQGQWKDRSNSLGIESSFDETLDLFQNSFERTSSSMDPWPLQSSHSNRSPHNYSQYNNNSSNHQPYHYNKHNINSLQLPPNPMGPYMRQNREQLLAKQQILEQYARQQKQLQLQQQQQQQQQHQQQQLLQQQYQYGGRSFNNVNNNNNFSYLGYGNSFRQSSPSSSSYQIERSGSVPPGLSSVDRAFSMPPTSSRYDTSYGDQSLYQRGSNSSGMQRNFSQRNSNQSSPFGSSSLSSSSSPLPMQSRSVNDLRVQSSDLRVDSNSFMSQHGNDSSGVVFSQSNNNDQSFGFVGGRFHSNFPQPSTATTSDAFSKLY